MACLSRLSLSLLSATVLTGLAAAPGLADDHTHWRLFVADHSEPVVRAFDIGEGAAGEFALSGFASLYASDSGRSVFAVQGDANRTDIIASGVSLHDHGDHADLEVGEAALLDLALEGERPVHFVTHDGVIALFYDGEGRADIFREGDVLSGALASVDAGEPHHGLVAPMGSYFIHSVAVETDNGYRPVALRIVDGDGEAVGEDIDCPGLHGEAPSGRLMAFGCHDGVVIARPGAGGVPEMTHIASEGLGEGNVSTLKGGVALQYFLGNYGPNAVVLIDPDAEAAFRKIDLPTRRVDFAIDPAQPRNAYVFTEDGQLHRLNVLSGEIDASATITDPYSMDGHWRDPRPRLAVAGAHIAITDPLEGVIRLVDTATLEEVDTIAVEGTPYVIVAVGGSGVQH